MLKKTNILFLLFFMMITPDTHAHTPDPDAVASPGLYAVSRDVYGQFVAKISSRLFSEDTGECAGPVYYCHGIMVSAFEGDDDYWMRAYPELSKLSLSYWTKRTTGQTGYDAAWLGTGFMLWPSAVGDKLSTGHLFTPRFTCIFAAEGLTGNQLHNGCGGDQVHAWPKCQDIGGHTAKEYTERFGSKRLNACGFILGGSSADDRLAFDSAMTLQLSEIRNYGGTFYNEVMMKGWEASTPEKIPLMGFFYIRGHDKLSPSGYRDLAKKNQAFFFNKTHVFVPIIRVTGSDWSHVRFEYHQADQSENISGDVTVNSDMGKAGFLSDVTFMR